MSHFFPIALIVAFIAANAFMLTELLDRRACEAAEAKRRADKLAYQVKAIAQLKRQIAHFEESADRLQSARMVRCAAEDRARADHLRVRLANVMAWEC